MQSNQNKLALVVGSAGEIGGCVSARLQESQLRVVGADAKHSSSLSREKQLVGRLDSKSAVDLLIRTVEERFGIPERVAIAIGTYRRISLADYSEDLYCEILNDNFGAIFWIVKSLALKMAEATGGQIAIVSSQAGATGGADPIYAAAKAATVALSKSVAREFGIQGVRCNVVAPGPVDTAMARAAMSAERQAYYRSTIPIGRFSTATEVAHAVDFLLSDGANSINGATIDVDGGLVRR